METISDTITTYLAAWNATEADERKSLLEKCFAADATYVDPHAGVLQGTAILNAMIERFRSQFPHRLVAIADLDTHHHVFRLPWQMQHETAGVLSSGLFVGEVNTQGQIILLMTFLDALNEPNLAQSA